jgi:hypothetical protein
MKIKRLAAAAAPVGIALLGSTCLAAAPASASSESKVIASSGGEILCSGDLCLQTVCSALSIGSVNTWAYYKTFYGHFEMSAPDDHYLRNSPTRSWPAGGTHSTFYGVPTSTPVAATAWEENKTTHKYTDLGTIGFTINYGDQPVC